MEKREVLIVKVDSTVQVDGRAAKVRCDELPDFIKAVRWDGKKGEIECADARSGEKHPNIPIASIEQWEYLIERWQNACEKEDAEIEARRIADEERAAEDAKLEGLTEVERKKAKQNDKSS